MEKELKLEAIQHKLLSEAPKRLHRMLLRIQKYDVKKMNVPRRDVQLADTLSRAPLTNDSRSQCEIDIEAIDITIDMAVTPSRL